MFLFFGVFFEGGGGLIVKVITDHINAHSSKHHLNDSQQLAYTALHPESTETTIVKVTNGIIISSFMTDGFQGIAVLMVSYLLNHSYSIDIKRTL